MGMGSALMFTNEHNPAILCLSINICDRFCFARHGPWAEGVLLIILLRVQNMTTHTEDLSMSWRMCLMFMLTVAIITAPDLGFAQTAATLADTPMGNVLCIVAGWFTGNTGKGLATIAITVIGVGALLGKVSWGMAMIIGIGVAIVFGAAGIVTSIGALNSGTTITPGLASC